jgi:exoribonuclease II
VSDFEGQIWAMHDNDDLSFVCVLQRNKNKVRVLTDKGREQSVSEDKLLWQHPLKVKDSSEWPNAVRRISQAVMGIRSTMDIRLLWESALELAVSEMDDLADLYFGGEIGTEQLAAIWLLLAEDRLYFKRKLRAWEPRTSQQLDELKQQREREQQRAKEKELARDWLKQSIRAEALTLPSELTAFAERLDAWLLRGDNDKFIEELIDPVAEQAKQTPRELVFDILQKLRRLPDNADRDVIIAGLKPEFSQVVQEACVTVQLWQPAPQQTITPLLCSIDDEDTREVDDALSIQRDGERWLIQIAIADPATLIHNGDVLDREAMRRGTTVYLPTQTVLMIPERISCDLASLNPNVVRSSIVLRITLDDDATVLDCQISREAIEVRHRLHYSDVDHYLKGNTSPEEHDWVMPLRQLFDVAQKLQDKRVAAGAFNLQRPEYKISISPDDYIEVTLLDRDSPSRLLVAEMMILANHLAASHASRCQVPFIYRVQEPPSETITPEILADPLGFYKVIKWLKPSTLSLHPGQHSGLGLSVYSQLSSPLRRFADLVMQRQLLAYLLGETLPYDQEELLKVLSTAERTAREAKQAESAAKRRWFIEYLNREWQNRPLEALLISTVRGGYKVELRPWGVEAFLGSSDATSLPPLGSVVTVLLDKAKVKTGQIRLRVG